MSRIKIDNVSKYFGSVKAVNDVTLEIKRGEFVTLLGPSGSGKTTTMRMIAGLEMPDKGTISIGEREVSSSSIFVPAHRRKLGMVFQSYAVWPHKTVYENVAFPLNQSNVAQAEQEKRVYKVLDLVELGAYAKRFPSQLSGGQQQRVALARALVAEPSVILFDEPLSNLDAQLRDSMRNLLADLHQELRITSVYVTHDQSEAMVLSDYVHVMDKGMLIQSGSPAKIFDHPANLFVATFVGKANVLLISSIDIESKSIILQGGFKLHLEKLPTIIEESAIIIRPHQVKIAAESEFENIIEGVVKNSYYLGDRARLEVHTQAANLTVDILPEQARPNVGDILRLRLPQEYCTIL